MDRLSNPRATRILGHHRLEAGILVRSLSEDAVARGFDSRSTSYRITESYDVQSAQEGAYVQDSWTGLGDRLTLTLGGRLDRFEETREIRVLPRASLTWEVSEKTKLLAAFEEYAQFPGFEELFGREGNPDLRAERAAHYLLGVEHSLGTSARHTIRI